MRGQPGYCLHKPSGRGYARFGPGAKPMYFPGHHGSDESLAAYHAAFAEYLAGGRPGRNANERLTVRQVLAEWMIEADRRYQKFGRRTSEFGCHVSAARPLYSLYADLPADEFGPSQLATVRERMVQMGWLRITINMNVARIKTVWKWAASRGLVPVAGWQALTTIAGLRKGKTAALESAPKRPATWQQLLGVLRICKADVGAMIRLQFLTGMRPGEVCALRPCDVDRGGNLWLYKVRPEAAKTDKEQYWLGPRAQRVLAPWLLKADGPEAKVFRPKTNGYTARIRTYCQRAGVEPFGAHQLRHAAATRFVNAYGREPAAGSLNHADPKMTARYSSQATDAAQRIARELG